MDNVSRTIRPHSSNQHAPQFFVPPPCALALAPRAYPRTNPSHVKVQLEPENSHFHATSSASATSSHLGVTPEVISSTSYFTDCVRTCGCVIVRHPISPICYTGAVTTWSHTSEAVSPSHSSVVMSPSRSSVHSGTNHLHDPSVSTEFSGCVPTVQVTKTTSLNAISTSIAVTTVNRAPSRCVKKHNRHPSLDCEVSSQQPTHSRNRSHGTINVYSIVPPKLPATPVLAQVNQPPKTPNEENGYDFAPHINEFSQYTSNIALECSVKEQINMRRSERRKETEPSPPVVWCMAMWDKVICLGCAGGKVEVSMTFE